MKDNTGLGLVQVYTGNGKGKTTASLGLAFRAVGQGFRVHISQFMKGRSNTGELKSAEKLAPLLTISQFGRQGFIMDSGPLPEDYELAGKAMEEAAGFLLTNEDGLLILDEILNALRYNLISLESVLKMIKEKPPGVEIVLTGRGAPPEIIDAADLVTEMTEIKHPYAQGIPSRRGIEY